jgi:glutamate N-acetyltransferase/amino-acid N-acetyltransferase
MIAPSASDHHQPAPDGAQTRLIELRGGLGAVPGVKLAGVAAGIKKRKPDLAVVTFDEPMACASVITTNEIKAAPLLVSEAHIAQNGTSMRAFVCNAGCANACTGARGERDARQTARQAATLLHLDPSQIVVASTGVIGVYLPMDRMSSGLERAIRELEGGMEAAYDAAEAIMTTDNEPKLAAYAFYDGETRYVVGGIAKGSGMIAPNMATMLAFVATNAPMSREALRDALRDANDGSFNMISVDGCMSTNDACYAFAKPGPGPAPAGFAHALRAVTRQLAIAMVTDGEGATKTLTVDVSGARDERQARIVARAIVNSNLVKTALYGEDPNWGRIVAAAGSVGAEIDPEAWSLYLGDKLWVERGAIEAISEAEAHRELENTFVNVRLDLGIGTANATAWGCDLSRDYVRINAHYRT